MNNPQMPPSETTVIDYAQAREFMVEQQVRPWDVLDPRVLEVMATLPREDFVPVAHRLLAYADLSLPIGHGESMMKPVIEGRTLQTLALESGDDVLEIGTGSGYLTACMARLAREVVSIERHADLADSARAKLTAQHLGNVRIEHVDAFEYSPSRKFRVICVTGAVEEIPSRFLEWLQPDGRLFAVRGYSPAMEAVIVENGPQGMVARSVFDTDLTYLAGAAPTPAFAL